MNGLFDNHEAWQKIIDDTSPQRPDVGKTVKVVEGRKYLGKVGKVLWHGRNKFSTAWRYGSDAQWHLRDVMGRNGFRIKIDTGTEKFFVDADKVEVIGGESAFEKGFVETEKALQDGSFKFNLPS